MTFMRAIENFKNLYETVEVSTVSGKVFAGKITAVDLEEIVINDSNGVAIIFLNHIVSVQKIVRTPTMFKKPVGRPAKSLA